MIRIDGVNGAFGISLEVTTCRCSDAKSVLKQDAAHPLPQPSLGIFGKC